MGGRVREGDTVDAGDVRVRRYNCERPNRERLWQVCKRRDDDVVEQCRLKTDTSIGSSRRRYRAWNGRGMEVRVRRQVCSVRIEEVDRLIEDDIFAALDASIRAVTVDLYNIVHSGECRGVVISGEVGLVRTGKADFAFTVDGRDMYVTTRPERV